LAHHLRSLHSHHPFPFFLLPRPPRSPLFPYTTLFRSRHAGLARSAKQAVDEGLRLRAERLVEAGLADLTQRGQAAGGSHRVARRSEEHTSELQSRENLVCRLLLEKKK